MKDLLDTVLQYVWQAWRLRWLALLVAWVVALSAWLIVDKKVQDQFVATARIVVDTNEILKPLLRDITVQNNVERRVALMSRTLLSRPNLEKLVDDAGLDGEFRDNLERENFLTYLSQNLDLWGDSRNRSLYTIYFPHADPQIAKRVVDTLITVFIEKSEGGNKDDSSAAQAFLDSRIKALEKRLVDSETRLSVFKRENAGIMPGESGGYYQRLEFSSRQLRQAQLDLREAQNREAELKRQIRSESPEIVIDGTAYQDPLDTQILDFQQQLSSLLVRYTDRHPRVQQLRDSIDALELQRAENESAPIYGNLQSSPVYQKMRSLLSETEATVAQLQVRVNEFQKDVTQLNGTIDLIPKVEAELQQLDRDYNVVLENYETMLQRREAARLSEQVEQNPDDMKFTVVDPPFVQTTPISPSKKMLFAMVLPFSIFAGIAVSVLISLLRPIFYNHRDLGKKTGLPVLGSVSLVKRPSMKLGSILGGITFGSLAVTLCLICWAIVYLQIHGTGEPILKQVETYELVVNVKESDLLQKVESSNFKKKVVGIVENML